MVLARQNDPIEPTAKNMTRSFLRQNMDKFEMAFPNVHKDHWGELDIMGVRPSGYIEEFEIKVSRSDFRADFKKLNTWKKGDLLEWSETMHRRIEQPKHECLRQRECFPNRFSFLVPEGLVSADDIPDGLGLYYAVKSSASESGFWITQIKKPALLHKEKINQILYTKFLKRLAWRYIDSLKEVGDSNA
jgi:hypothetical protein